MIKPANLLEKYSLSKVKSALALNEEQAIKFANSIGFPVAMKIESPEILHKTEIGGVKLNLYSDKEVKEAYNAIIKSAKNSRPSIIIDGIMIQEMVSNGLELIMGYNNDKVFGPIIMLGLGGIFTELLKDITFSALPLKKDAAFKMIKQLKNSKIVLEGYRGLQPVSLNMLENIIIKVSEMAVDLFYEIDSFDINPIVCWGDKYKIVDFKYVVSSNKKTMPSTETNISNIDLFFKAKSVAIIGASGSSKEKIGNYILKSLVDSKYKGKVYPINPKYDSIDNIKTYSSIRNIPGKVDLVVISIPLQKIFPIIEDCNKKDVKNIVIISGGGKEIGLKELEAEIKRKAASYGIRIIGCNCIGVMDGYTQLNTFFYPREKVSIPSKGSISMMTQSGTVGVAFIEKMKKIGVNKFVSVGNKIDVDEGDLIEYFGNDPKTKAISVHIEGLENGKKFLESIKKISAFKPIIIYKSGRTDVASSLSQSHTGVMSSSYDLVSSIFKQIDINVVDNFEDFIAASKILSLFNRTKGNKVMIVTNGAGATIQAFDKISQKGKLNLAQLPVEFKKKLKEKLPPYAVVENTIDLTGSSSDEDYEISIKACFDCKEIDIIMVWIMLQNPSISDKIYLKLEKLCKMSNKPIILGALGEDFTYKIRDLLENRRIPLFLSVGEWVTAAESLCIQ